MSEPAMELVLPLTDQRRLDLPQLAPPEPWAQVQAEPAVRRGERGRAPVRLASPHLPPLVRPLVEGEPPGGRVPVGAVQLGRLDLDQEPLCVGLRPEGLRTLLTVRIQVAGDVACPPAGCSHTNVRHSHPLVWSSRLREHRGNGAGQFLPGDAGMLDADTTKRSERGRVAAALGLPVAPVAELVRPLAQPQVL